MSGFSMEQPVTVTGLGVAQPMPYFGPQMSVTGISPSRHVGIYDPISTERPCGGYGGYDAAANESRRLMEAGWNSVTTNDIHETWRNKRHELIGVHPNHGSNEMPIIDLTPKVDVYQSLLKIREDQDKMYRRTEEIKRQLDESVERCKRSYEPNFIEIAKISRQSDLLTVFEQTGDSHISHVRGKGYHVTTQVPGIGRDEGLDRTLSFHTYVKPDRSGRLRFDSDY